MAQKIPDAWTYDWERMRPVKIAFRQDETFKVKDQVLPSNGRTVNVHRPYIMEEGGHSLYAGKTCWMVERHDDVRDQPEYLTEGDFVWINDDDQLPVIEDPVVEPEAPVDPEPVIEDPAPVEPPVAEEEPAKDAATKEEGR